LVDKELKSIFPYRDEAIVALMPALNEEKTIRKVVQGVLEYVDLVIVIDDVSTDNTVQIARQAGAYVLSLKRRRRLGGVIKTGLEYVKKLNPKIVVMLDSDGQHEPSDVPRLLKPLLEGKADWVLGSRFIDGPRLKSSKSKNVGRKMFSRITSFVSGQKITDAMSGFRVLSREALNNLHLRFDYGYAPEMDVILSKEGYKVVEVPILDRPREYGKTRVVTSKFMYVLKQFGIIFYSYIRLKFFNAHRGNEIKIDNKL